MSRKAFTLAEVLITLTVIGVVAALTIPTLLQSTNGAETKAALKKVYSDLSQATALIRNDLGGNITGGYSSISALEEAYKGKLSYVKECVSGTVTGTTTSNCFNSTIVNYKGDSDTTTVPNGTAYALVLSSGTSIAFTSNNSACTIGAGTCGNIVIDINGLKTPNKIGKDIFLFEIHPTNGLIPAGATTGSFPSTAADSACDAASGNGYACTAEMLYPVN